VVGLVHVAMKGKGDFERLENLGTFELHVSE
jgi:hypothetical protein